MKNCFLFLFIFFLFFSEETAVAQTRNIAGGHIAYRHLSSFTYEITTRIYMACDTLPVTPNDTLWVSWQGGGFHSNMNLVGVTEVTGRYKNCTTVSRCNGGTSPGFNEYLYKDTVDLSTISACKITFSRSGGTRWGAITTGAANTPFYIYSEINKCVGANSSAQMTFSPQFVLPLGKDAYLTSSLIDSVEVDSLRFDLVAALVSPSSAVKYNYQLNYLHPSMFLGFPNSNLNFPAGFHFENTTSNVAYRPTKSGETTIIVTEGREYRIINGQRLEVGKTRLEHVLFIEADVNSPPGFSGSFKDACAGNERCFTIVTRDNDATDSLILLTNNGLKSAQFNTDGAKKPTGTFCWTPSMADIRPWPHLFTFRVYDDKCGTKNGFTTLTAAVMVYFSTDSTAFIPEKKEVSCNRVSIKMKHPATGTLKRGFITPDTEWMSYSNSDSIQFYTLKTGWYKYGVWARHATACTDTLWDSVFVNPPYVLQINTTPDSTVCPADTFTLAVSPANGTAPYLYSITQVPVFSAVSAYKKALTKSDSFYLKTIDSIGCFAKKTVHIGVHTLQQVSLSLADSFCANDDPIALLPLASPPGGTWSGQGVNTNTFTPQLAFAGSNTLTYTANDSNNCPVQGTKAVTVLLAPLGLTASPGSAFGWKPMIVPFWATSTPLADTWLWRIEQLSATSKDSVTTLIPFMEYTFTDTGRYSVSVVGTIGNCSETYILPYTIMVGPLAGIETAFRKKINAYPNPLETSYILTIDEKNIRSIQFTDITGRKIPDIPVEITADKTTADVSSMAPGIYLAHIQYEDNFFGVFRFIIKE